MPLIRYRTGDCAAMHRGPCSCGRATPRLGPIIGRKHQKLKFKGASLVSRHARGGVGTNTRAWNRSSSSRGGKASCQTRSKCCSTAARRRRALREQFQARAKIAPHIRHDVARGDRGAADAAAGQETQHVHGFAMKPCIVIPCFNHAATVAEVARAALVFCPVIIVSMMARPFRCPRCPDANWSGWNATPARARPLKSRLRARDGTGIHTCHHDGRRRPAFRRGPAKISRRDRSATGRAARGRAGFLRGGRSGGTATFQCCLHFLVSRRNRHPAGRHPMRFSRLSIGVDARNQNALGPVCVRAGIPVRAAWVGAPVVPLPVKCVYLPGQLRQSHFRPIKDLAHITIMNIGLVLQSWFVPRTLRVAWSFGQKNHWEKSSPNFWRTTRMTRCACRWRWGWDCFSASRPFGAGK